MTPAPPPGATPAGRARVSAIILAGGRSRRFGSDKLTADLDGAPLLHHAVRAAATVSDELVLVGPRDGTGPLMPVDLGTPVVVVRDDDAYPGPLAALLGGARAATGTRLLIVAGDMPSLLPALLGRLLAWDHGVGACLVVAGEPQVLPLGLDRDAAIATADRLLAAEVRSLRALVAGLDLEQVAEAEWRVLDPQALSLRDIDRPSDLETRP